MTTRHGHEIQFMLISSRHICIRSIAHNILVHKINLFTLLSIAKVVTAEFVLNHVLQDREEILLAQ